MNRLLEIPEYREDVERVAKLNLPWEKLYGKTLLITGGTGLIGSFLIDVLFAAKLGCRVILFGRSEEKARRRFSEYFGTHFIKFVPWDAGAPELPKVGEPIDYILHLASNTHPVAYATDPIGTIATNVMALNLLLKLAADGGALGERALPRGDESDAIGTIASTGGDESGALGERALPRGDESDAIGTIASTGGDESGALGERALPETRFLFASSNEIYGENRGDVELFDEKYCGYIDCNTLRAGYPESKRCGEALCQAYIKQKGLDCVIARLTRTFGPTILPTDTKAISQFFKNALAGEDIVLKSEGRQYFSYQYVADSVSGLLTVLLKGETGAAYNIADESGDITLRDLAALIAAQTGRKVVFDLPNATEAAGFSKATKARLDGSRLRVLGWKPLYDIGTGVKRNIAILSQI